MSGEISKSFFNYKLKSLYYAGELRFVGGACQLQGRIEIFHSGIWGTVCDNGFGYNDAVVVCRQLGSRYKFIFGNFHTSTAYIHNYPLP